MAAASNDIVSSVSPSGFYVKDELTGNEFLVDTGAFCSIFPATSLDKTHIDPNIPNLVAANGSKIASYGFRLIPLKFMGRRFEWRFILADVRRPLLGADFLANYKLLIDVARKRLIDTESCSFFPLLVTNQQAVNECSPRATGLYAHLFEEYPEVFRAELKQNPGGAPKHGIVHHIKTNGPPVHSRFRRLPPDKLRIAKEYFAEMERMGLCSKAASPWASPLHMVPKPDGTYRPCGDYRRLNLLTEPDHYPTPNITDITGNLHGSKVFSKLDLLKGYFQVPMNPADIPKTAIITPFGTYVFYYSTFGLRNSGATFQRMMDTIFGNINFCIVYVDDILVFSKSHEEHQDHLRCVLKLLRENGLVVRPDKCIFGTSSIDFLGHVIDESGIQPSASKVDAIRRFPTPCTVKEVQKFVGMINFYHRFIPFTARLLKPLYAVSSGKSKCFKWDDEQQNAFEAAKVALINATILHHPAPGAPLILSTDASSTAVGAVLEQEVDGATQPLAFFSRKLRDPELKYSTFDRELLAVYLSIRHFKHVLDGACFRIRTDHRPLVHALVKSSDAWSARQQRHLSTIAEMNCSIEYVKGEANPVADALSRVDICSVHFGIDYSAMSEEQKADPETLRCRETLTGLKWKDVAFGDVTLLCDVSTGRPRPFVPEKFRREVFNTIHSLSHPSIRSTVKLVTQKFVWNSVRRDVRQWSRTCLDCQKSKVFRHTDSGIGQFPHPKRRFGHVHVDIVGPLPPSNGFRYLFTVTERSTRWPEAVPMEDASARSCATAFLSSWVSRFGTPDIVTSDRGSVFLSEFWRSLGDLMGTRLHHTTAYNPSANGLVERVHRTLKQALMARCADSEWSYNLPWVLLGLRTTPKEGLNVSPAEMVYGETITVPGEFFPPSEEDSDVHMQLSRLRKVVGEYRPFIPSKDNDARQRIYVPRDLLTAKYVFVRHDSYRSPLSPPYKGPYLVLARKAKVFQLELESRTDWVSIDRLKPAYVDQDFDENYYTRSGRKIVPPSPMNYR